jgi:hypothetical protein
MTLRIYLIPNHEACETSAFHQWRYAALLSFVAGFFALPCERWPHTPITSSKNSSTLHVLIVIFDKLLLREASITMNNTSFGNGFPPGTLPV